MRREGKVPFIDALEKDPRSWRILWVNHKLYQTLSSKPGGLSIRHS